MAFEKPSVVKIRDMTFGYNGRPVLKNINIDVHRGDYFALIGPNGAAKSTLLKLMVGLLKPWHGSISLFDHNIRHFKSWYKMGYISQHALNINTAFPATVREVVTSGYYTGITFRHNSLLLRRSADEAMTCTGIAHISSRLISELSGGQRQRVFLARALVHHQEVLFLDEPTANIDAVAREELYDLLTELNRREDLTIVLITHDISAIFNRANKVGCVGNGSVHIHNIQEITEAHLAEIFGYKINGC